MQQIVKSQLQGADKFIPFLASSILAKTLFIKALAGLSDRTIAVCG